MHICNLREALKRLGLPTSTMFAGMQVVPFTNNSDEEGVFETITF